MEIIKQSDGTYHIIIGSEVFIRKEATQDMVAKFEQLFIEKTSPYLGKIEAMNERQFRKVTNLLMNFDWISGNTPGQIPTRIFNFTPEFKVYEKKVWAEVNKWLATNKPPKKND